MSRLLKMKPNFISFETKAKKNNYGKHNINIIKDRI